MLTLTPCADPDDSVRQAEPRASRLLLSRVPGLHAPVSPDRKAIPPPQSLPQCLHLTTQSPLTLRPLCPPPHLSLALSSCLLKDPQERPSAEALLFHPFMRRAAKERLTTPTLGTMGGKSLQVKQAELNQICDALQTHFDRKKRKGAACVLVWLALGQGGQGIGRVRRMPLGACTIYLPALP